MLVFSAIVPHPPVLIPSIGKDEIKKIEKTKQAIEQLEQDLYLSKPDIIIIISPHGSLFTDAFSINAHTHFVSDFEQFGDLTTKLEWTGADSLAAKIKQGIENEDVPLQLISQEQLDHGSTIPLYGLTKHLPDIKILPIGYSELESKIHLKFGESLKEVIMESNKRIAVIASGDLSHALTTDAPAGFSKTGQEFDNKIIELLENKNTTGIANMDDKIVDSASECGYRSILILLGILKNMDYSFKNYSYEAPFGVGYLVGNFVL
ncbi:MAG: AmmeMemoRadiSam system protein B [Candidatus Magasanikbacteria bacterium]|jgi:MEMO1 family protein|nr:AmmeMemoRadiSam system protein B [Candidatus Magasanikbacteria bacterium]MBT4314910.1 AmmeMemoRadiSam system protein B [Candidatus Magasanikbacteria bacterium]MBT4546866.1 AmmeMemoRadiSam system protein B [Candidatus Magasanikbacteria bacterium]MBT6819220.1 AmmeMemoRadiSam system protein B [Candidatus Magasanikbacteria bacterium]